MLFKRTFLYNSDADDNGGGGQEGNDNNDQNQPELPTEVQQQLAEAALWKTELEELRAFKAANTKEPERSSEEIAKEEQLEKVNFRKFAVENDYAKDEDFVQLETLQQKKDYDLIFEGFLNDFKEENFEITDEKEILEAAKEEFETQYKLNSKNEKTKERGLARLAKDAAEIRNPYSSKIEKAKGEYNNKKELAATYEKKFIPFTDAVKKAIPTKLTFATMKDGDIDVPFELEVTDEDIKEVEEKFLKNHKTFYQFKEGKPEEVQDKLLSKISNYLISKKKDDGAKKIAEYYEGVGVRKGSTTGADAPFHLRQGNGLGKQKAALTLEASNDKIAQARARFN